MSVVIFTQEKKRGLETALKVIDIGTSSVAVPFIFFQIICGGRGILLIISNLLMALSALLVEYTISVKGVKWWSKCRWLNDDSRLSIHIISWTKWNTN
jgi:hypothetical protein